MANEKAAESKGMLARFKKPSSGGKIVKKEGKNRSPGKFIREVVAELKKVTWPTRKELINYTIVVVVFIALLSVIIGGLDWLASVLFEFIVR